MIWVNTDTGVMVYGNTDAEAQRRLSRYLEVHPDEPCPRGGWERVDAIWLLNDGTPEGDMVLVDTIKRFGGKVS